MTRHRSAAILTAVLVACSLAACIPTAPKPTATAAATPAPTPSSVPVAAGPTARIDATCDDILDTRALQAFVGVNVQPLTAVAAADRLTPDAAAIEQLGGLTCRWTNGLSSSYFSGPDANAQFVELSIVPEGLEAASEYVDLYQIADPTYGDHVQGPRCVADIGYCELAGVIGAAWIEVGLQGIVGADGADEGELLAGFRSIIDPMVASVATMTPRDRWEPEAPSAISDADCAALAPTEEIIGLTAIPNLHVGPQWDGPRVGQYWYATEQMGALRCSLAMSDSDSSVGQIGILPSGSWGYDRYAESWIDEGGAPVDIDGIADGDAIIRCADAASSCIVDFTVSGDWVRVLAYPVPDSNAEYGPPVAYYESARAAVAGIAGIVAQRILAS